MHDAPTPAAGPSNTQYTRSISGLLPGTLDPEQSRRLLRHPQSKLFFASYNPLTASALHGREDIGINSLSLNEQLYRAKRVVVEVTPDGQTFWRFVPKARRDAGVDDEGTWPRVIDLCGEHVLCSQEQFEIYKLDSTVYDCLVQAYPKPTIITRVTRPSTHIHEDIADHAKRRLSSPTLERGRASVNPKKYRRQTPVILSSEDEDGINSEGLSDEEEVEGMIVDGSPSKPRARSRSQSVGPSDRRKKLREKIEEGRRFRRDKLSASKAKVNGHANGAESGPAPLKEDESMADIPGGFPTTPQRPPMPPPPPSTGKRKGPVLNMPINGMQPVHEHEMSPLENPNVKKTRVRSPGAVQREIQDKRQARERKRNEERAQRDAAWREAKRQQFFREIMQCMPPPGSTTKSAPEPIRRSPPTHSNSDSPENPDLTHAAAIEESRRKLAALERDRPLWEEAARRRAASEQAEDRDAGRRKRAMEEAERRVREEEVRREEERRREEEERVRREERERENRREEERRHRMKRWTFGPWTPQRALERYKSLADEFDTGKFGAGYQLTFDQVPWPVLHSPLNLTVEDIDWGAVEDFFRTVRPSMRPQDWKVFVEKSQRRFHPDRWRARGLLKSVRDEGERGEMEVAVGVVSQAVNPIWRDLKAR